MKILKKEKNKIYLENLINIIFSWLIKINMLAKLSSLKNLDLFGVPYKMKISKNENE